MGQLFKNVGSQKVRVFAFADAGHASLDAGEAVTGDAANISAQVAVDNAALGASNDAAPAEIDATNAPGYYEFDPTQAETNGDVVEWYPKSSTAGVQVITVGGSIQTTQPQYLPDLGIESDGDLTKVNTLDGHTAQTADHTAGIADVPTVAEFNARTLLAASYFDPAADAVANVTLVATTTTNTDMRGTDSASTHSAADVWAVATRVLTANTNLNDPSAATITGAVWSADFSLSYAASDAAQYIKEIRTDAEDLQTQIGTAGAGLTVLGGMSTAMKAEILTEVNAAIDTAISELGVAAPTATPTLRTGMMLMYMALRNKLVVQTSGTDAIEIYNDAGTKIAAKTITDDGSDYTESEMA